MTTRFVVWHIPTPGSPTPVFYIDRDCEAVALRIYAERAPGAGDLLVDILDDGVSIMDSNDYQKMTLSQSGAYIEVGTPSAADFTAGETITGGTSVATAKVVEYTITKSRLYLIDVSGTFTVGETITGGSSAATGKVDAYVRATKSAAQTTVNGQSHATLPKNTNSNDAAQDFKDSVQIAEGSWLSLSQVDLAGASNVTIQLELDELSESVGSRPE